MEQEPDVVVDENQLEIVETIINTEKKSIKESVIVETSTISIPEIISEPIPAQNNSSNNNQIDGYSEVMKFLAIKEKENTEREIERENERIKRDKNQKLELNQTLKNWADSISISVKEAISASTSVVSSSLPISSNSNIDGYMGDLKDRQSKIIDEIKDAHAKQMDILRNAISDERRDATQVQQIFEKTLQTKYENMVRALQEKIKAEQEQRMKRALDDLEMRALTEGERARESIETQKAAEKVLSTKFKSIVADLRRSWEEEETNRAKQLEERLRSHYSAVLEHMEAQLQMALQLQDEADKQWMEDVEARNKQQVTTIKAFEDKCRRLYDTRLTEYMQRSDEQMSNYEDQLLEVGSNLATERSRYESRQRRLQMACSRWKLQYQSELHDKYQNVTADIESKYMSEIEILLGKLEESKAELSKTNERLHEKERDLLRDKARLDNKSNLNSNQNNDSSNSNGSETINLTTSQIKEELTKKWQELGTPVDERVSALASLLDTVTINPQTVAKYNATMSKLSSRLPITQMIARKQYIEYKIKLSQRNSNVKDVAQLPEFNTESQELQTKIDLMTSEYERKYNEKFSTTTTNNSTNASSSLANSKK